MDAGTPAYEPLLTCEVAPVLDVVRDLTPVLRLASRVPPAVCHNDVNPDNLLLRRTPQGLDELVVFDWQMVGVAPVSSDLAQLLCYVPATLDGRSREEIERSVVAEYVAAVEEAGFALEPDLVLAAHIADGAARQAMFCLYVMCSEITSVGTDGARAVVDHHVSSMAASHLPDLTRRALDLALPPG